MVRPGPGLTLVVTDAPDPRRWKALGVCLVAGFMTLLDVSIVNVALPSIREGIGASTSELQWVVSGYALAFGLVLVPAGRLGDARGRRTMFIVGVALFTLSSLAAGLAPTAFLLVVARLVQGLGGGILNPQVSGLIQELFRGRERGRAFGMLGAVIGISTAVGPVLGGLIIRLLGVETGWRWIFFVNIPIGIAAIALSLRLLPGGPREETPTRRDLDLVGVGLLGAGVLAVLLPLVEQQEWRGDAKWALLAGGVMLLAVFVLWERRYAARGHAALVDLSLFALPSYSAGSALAMAYFSGFTGIFFVLTLYFQGGLGYSPLLAGLAVTPFAAGSAVAAALGGRVVTTAGRPLVVGGLVAVVLGLVLTDVALALHGDSRSAGWWTALPLLVGGLGSGLVISPNQTLTLTEVPVARAGTAGGVLQTGQRMGTAVGIAVVGSTYFGALSSSRGDYGQAASQGLRAAVALTTVALLIGVADVVRSRRSSRGSSARAAAGHQPAHEGHADATSQGDGEGASTPSRVGGET
ncbi:drug resistance transporter, EmrB/QacA subfamily [Pedococcus cremeus]|uniref:Drug resistance transporter, EmrB/QacA subfamily n=1 Tax=Pedococcus cremeus TaxID=587636 RepID=A0A1H9TG79_9MICO|nr:drug resistance transporter, EmrB/QacA subfamily [Pedococcus cremeus]